MRVGPILLGAGVAAVAAFMLLVPDWERPGMAREVGPRALAMDDFAPPARRNAAPDRPAAPLPAVPDDPRPATEAFRNVQVLTEVDAAGFMRLQHAITAWVAAEQGCSFCHSGADYAAEDNPRKQAARAMLRMVRQVNSDSSGHVGQLGVTCYTCHQGQPVPPDAWRPGPAQRQVAQVARQDQWNETASNVRDFFPDAALAHYLLQETPGLVQARAARAPAQVGSAIEIKRLYEAMMQMADGIGVGCVHCHNSRAFTDWQQSTPARWAGFSGIQMTRALNRDVLLPLAAELPQLRPHPGVPLSPSMPEADARWRGGNALLTCATCHHGLPVPLHGADLLSDHPALRGASR